MTKKEIMKQVNCESKVLDYILTMAENGKCKDLELCQQVLAAVFVTELRHDLFPGNNLDLGKRLKPIIELLEWKKCDQSVIDYGLTVLKRVSLRHAEAKASYDMVTGEYNPVNHGLDIKQEDAKLDKEIQGKSNAELDKIIPNVKNVGAWWK